MAEPPSHPAQVAPRYTVHLAVLHDGEVLVIRDGVLRIPRVHTDDRSSMRESAVELLGLLTMDHAGPDAQVFHLFSSQENDHEASAMYLWDAPERFTPPGVHSEWIPFAEMLERCEDKTDALFAKSWTDAGFTSVAHLREAIRRPTRVLWGSKSAPSET